MIHFHGTPISPRSELQRMAGKHFCVSFAEPRDGDWCLANAQSVLWDSGAFTAFTRKEAVDWDGYYAWLEPRLGHPHWAIIPDVIDGSVEEQKALVAEWQFDAWLGAPVWHMGLPIDYLVELADEWPRICFGSSGRYWQVGSIDWCRRADESFNALAKRGPLPWVHMLRGLSLCGDQWPFASGDSTNVARNFKNVGSETDPERMARRIDAVQCPIKWTLQPQQKDMFAA